MLLLSIIVIFTKASNMVTLSVLMDNTLLILESTITSFIFPSSFTMDVCMFGNILAIVVMEEIITVFSEKIEKRCEL